MPGASFASSRGRRNPCFGVASLRLERWPDSRATARLARSRRVRLAFGGRSAVSRRCARGRARRAFTKRNAARLRSERAGGTPAPRSRSTHRPRPDPDPPDTPTNPPEPKPRRRRLQHGPTPPRPRTRRRSARHRAHHRRPLRRRDDDARLFGTTPPLLVLGAHAVGGADCAWPGTAVSPLVVERSGGEIVTDATPKARPRRVGTYRAGRFPSAFAPAAPARPSRRSSSVRR